MNGFRYEPRINAVCLISEIAKLLLLYGANVNDQGGDHCGHVTPLHDASQNGHIETVRMLVERGADLHAKDKKVLHRSIYNHLIYHHLI